MKLVNTHRKCLKCNVSTTDLNQDKCSCGSYMHLTGFIYQPAPKEKNAVKAQAS